MGTEANKNLVREWVRALSEGRVADARKFFTDDVQWWVSGTGDISMDYVESFWASACSKAPGPDFVKIIALTADEDRVAFEHAVTVEMPDGRTYTNCLHMLLYVRDGQFCKVREHLDTAYVQSFLGAVPDHQKLAG